MADLKYYFKKMHPDNAKKIALQIRSMLEIPVNPPSSFEDLDGAYQLLGKLYFRQHLLSKAIQHILQATGMIVCFPDELKNLRALHDKQIGSALLFCQGIRDHKQKG